MKKEPKKIRTTTIITATTVNATTRATITPPTTATRGI